MLLLAGFVLAGVTLLQAQEGPPPAPAAGQTEAASDPAADPGSAESSPAASEAAPLPDASQRPVGPTPNRFEPTEKVRADFDVSFPVDI